MRKQSRHTTLAHLPPPRDSPASSRVNGPPGGHFRCLPVAGVLLGVAVAFFCAQGRAEEADNPDAVRPLPEIDRGVFDRIRFAALGDPQDLSEPLMADDVAPPGQPRQEFEPPAGRKLPPGAKPGILQQALFTVTELPKFGSNGLGLTNLEQSITLGLPAPTPASPLLVTAGFVGTLVDKPTGVDMPNELFEGYVQARWLRKLTEKLGMDLAVSPGWYSDFKNDTPQAMRITGHGFGAWEATENLRVIAGLIYLDRYDVNMLPAGGLLWTPYDSTRFELIFPRPRLAWRVAESQRAAQWLYVAAEFGGNQWATQSSSGNDQVMVIRDYRLLAGWERRPANLGLNWRLETGWVFGRTVQYYFSNDETFNPSNTFLARAGIWY